MPQIVCRLDRSLPDWAMECGHEFHEGLLCDLRVRRAKGEDEAREVRFNGVAISERLTLGPWEVRAGPAFFFSMRGNNSGSWRFDPPAAISVLSAPPW